ncbi:MAG: translocation/assembly module TamB domain-containing protein [Bacteroidia bacterium]|nr:translocation/assembly module TamB domain-containing protein [Bacteroidia bacterium]
MTKTLHYIRKVLVALLFTGVALIVLSLLLLAIPSVDSYLCKKIEEKVAESIGVPVRIGELQYYPLRTISLRDIVLMDRDSVVMASISRVKVSLDISSLFDSSIRFSQFDIDSLHVHIKQISDEPSVYNLSLLAGTDTIPSDEAPLFSGVELSNLMLSNSEIIYTPLSGKGMAVTDINAKIDEVKYGGSGFKLALSHLNMLMDNRRSYASGVISYSNDTLSLASFKSYSANSLSNFRSLTISSLKNVDEGQLPEVDADIDLLVLDEPNIAPKVSLTGVVKTQRDRVELEGVTIDVFDNTHLVLDGEVSKWRDIERSSVNVTASDIILSPRDIFEYVKVDMPLELSETLRPLSGDMTMRGSLAAMDVETQLFGSTMSIIFETKVHCNSKDEVAAEGTLSTSYYPYTQQPLTVGPTVAEIGFNGVVSPKAEYTYFNIKGNFPMLTALGYPYQDIEFYCIAKESAQWGYIEMTDEENGALMLTLNANSVGEYPYYDITLNADSLHIGALSIAPSLPESVLDCKARVIFDGTNIDNAEGIALVDNFSLTGIKNPIMFNRLDARVKRQTADRNRSISVKSDNIDAHVEGRFKVEDLLAEISSQLHKASPSLSRKQKYRVPADTWMDMTLRCEDISPLTQLVDSNLIVSGVGTLKAKLRAADHASSLALNIDKVQHGDREVEGLGIEYTSHVGDTAVLELYAKSLQMSTLGSLGAFHNANKLYKDALSSHFCWQSTDGTPRANIGLGCKFSRDKHDELVGNIAIDSSFIQLGPRRWSIPTSSIVVAPHSLQVNNFAMTHGDRYINVDGKSSLLHPQDTIEVRLNKFAISDVLKTTPEDKFSLDGDVSAVAYLNDIFGNVIVNCKSSIDSLYVDGDNLEHMDIETAWQPENKNLDLHLAIVTHGRQCVDANGQLDIAQNRMFLNFDIDSLSIGFLNFYLDAAINDMRGTTSGNLQLHGPLDDIKLNSRLCVHKSDFSVMQTYVRYYINDNDSIILSPTKMEFKNLRFVDRYGKQGTFGGYIDHDMFSNLRMFIDFNVDDMLVLESQEVNSPTYYGTVFGKGYFGIRGTTSLCQLNVKAHTSPNSIFYILPLQKSDIGQNDYIRFSQKVDAQESEEKKDVAKEDFNLMKQQEGVVANLQIDIRPDAKIYAIVDPRSDNMVEAKGQGLINIDLTREGNLLMEGIYTMEQGTYNFNLQNIVNKKFDIRKGSTVMWNGDPYDAIVDLVATYKTRASLYDLVQGGYDESSTDLKKRVPINCNLFLTEHLLNPKIRFEIEIPSSQNFSQYTFDQYVNTEEEMNRQVFSLLLAGRFYTSSQAQSNLSNSAGGASTSNYLGTTLSELMSNQFSDWLSQNRYNVGMGVNYRPGDEVTNEEYEVALQTGVLDNKIILSGNIGYGRDVSSESNNEGSFIGDFDVEVKLNKSETLRAKAYTHSNNDVIYETSPTTQGIGISYQESFDTFRELLKKYFGWMRRKRSAEEEADTEK